ncbi:MAG: hypothetical protein KGY70_18445 [Bacteroidales bacterium]|nr:hypothetical protein [Bacteroidales bacterium]
MKIYLATWLLEKMQGESLTKAKGKRRLVSYHFLTEQGINKKQLWVYCETGKNPEK